MGSDKTQNRTQNGMRYGIIDKNVSKGLLLTKVEGLALLCLAMSKHLVIVSTKL